MRKKYKNPLYEAIQRAGFEPSEFTGTETTEEGKPCFVVQYKQSSLTFTFLDPDVERAYVYNQVRRPFPGALTTMKSDGRAVNFEHVVQFFTDWLTSTVLPYKHENEQEAAAPDLWAQIDYGKTIIGATVPDERSTAPFTRAEKVRVRSAIQNFRKLIAAELEPTQEQLEDIGIQLDYLSNAVDRLNKFDWRGLAIQTIIGIATTLSLDTQKGQQLWKLFQQAFRAVLQLASSS